MLRCIKCQVKEEPIQCDESVVSFETPLQETLDSSVSPICPTPVDSALYDQELTKIKCIY